MDEAQIAGLIKSPPQELQISTWISSPQDWPTLYSREDGCRLEKMWDNMNRLSLAKKKFAQTRFILHQPLHRFNYREMASLLKRAHKLGFDRVTFSPLKPLPGNPEAIALTTNQKRTVEKEIMQLKQIDFGVDHNLNDLLHRMRIGPDVWQTVPCYMPWSHARIRSNGSVTFCNNPNHLMLGDINQQPFSVIWNDRPIQKLRKQLIHHDGYKHIIESMDCAYCCHVLHNLCVHQVVRRLSWIKLMIPTSARL
ncbi:SPASM domain-containing protein [candidate division KSB1 bacterium]|nr:SPASM domain-containing protein [candidate division KSB1 bacterium]